MSLGAWRDRTNLFISYRQSYTHHPAKRTRYATPTSNGDRYSDNVDIDNERAGLMSNLQSDGDAVIEKDLLPPRWLDIQDEVSQCLADVAGKMRKLDQLHAKHVLPGFDDESVKAKEGKEIEALTQDITRAFSSCQRAIKRVDKMLLEQQNSQAGNLSAADEKMANNLKISQATRVGEVSTLFRKKQSAYLKKMQSLGGMSAPLDRSSTPVVQNPYTSAAMMDEEADRSTAQSTLQQTAQVRRRQGVMDSTIAQRELEIENIAQGVIDLSNIFQELNTMVIDQGSMLDRIDYNVERTAEHVKAADKELKVAGGYQKKSTKRKIILLLVLIVVGMIILLVIKPKKGAAPAAPAPANPAPAPPIPNEGAGQLPPRGKSWSSGAHQKTTRSRRRLEWKQRRRRGGQLSLMLP